MSEKFDALRAAVNANPRRRARVDGYKQEIATALKLAELRKQRRITQREMARLLGVSQARISQIERGTNLEVTTLGTYLAALGAQLEINAAFDDTTVALTEPHATPA